MIQRRCNSCGAPLKQYNWNNWVCEYCGNTYQDEYRKPVSANYSYYGNSATYADYIYTNSNNEWKSVF